MGSAVLSCLKLTRFRHMPERFGQYQNDAHHQECEPNGNIDDLQSKCVICRLDECHAERECT